MWYILLFIGIFVLGFLSPTISSLLHYLVFDRDRDWKAGMGKRLVISLIGAIVITAIAIWARILG